jgi:hypothetical protein
LSFLNDNVFTLAQDARVCTWTVPVNEHVQPIPDSAETWSEVSIAALFERAQDLIQEFHTTIIQMVAPGIGKEGFEPVAGRSSASGGARPPRPGPGITPAGRIPPFSGTPDIGP